MKEEEKNYLVREYFPNVRVIGFSEQPKEFDMNKFDCVLSKVDHTLDDVVATVKGEESIKEKKERY